MAIVGTVRRRRKRNLAKVNGLSTVPYNPLKDTFTGQEVFSTKRPDKNWDDPSISIRNSTDTRLRMSATTILSHNANRNARVTRDPSFHRAIAINDDDIIGTEFDLAKRVDCTSGSINAEDYVYNGNRTHFLDNVSIYRLRQVLLLGAASGTFPWSWNNKTFQIDKWKPSIEKLWNVQWTLVTIQTLFLTGFQFYSFVSRVGSDIKTYREVFMNSVSVYWYVCAVYFNVNMFLYKDQIRHYINTLFKFNQEFVGKYVIDLEDYEDGGRLVINLSIPSNTSQVFASVALFLVIPYQPWYLYSYIYPKPWYYLIPGAIHEFVVVGQVISNYILYQWIMVAHANSMEFWLREIHNHNDTGFTKDILRHPKTAIEVYRTLQVLSTCFNACMSPLAIPLMKLHILTGLIPCGYVFIRSMNSVFVKEFPGILTYPICVIDCATAGFTTLALAAEVYDLSYGFVESWGKTKQKDFRRILMSCHTLRVWVGRMYYVTITTTITFFKVAVDLVTACIISFP